jgi:hypothetical protein
MLAPPSPEEAWVAFSKVNWGILMVLMRVLGSEDEPLFLW